MGKGTHMATAEILKSWVGIQSNQDFDNEGQILVQDVQVWICPTMEASAACADISLSRWPPRIAQMGRNTIFLPQKFGGLPSQKPT